MNPRSLISILTPYFPAMVSGILVSAAFPDPGLFYLAFAALVPFWVSLNALTPRQGARAGLVFGLTHYLSLIYWLVPTLTTYGGIHLVLALACLVLLCLYLALYPAAFAWIMARGPGPSWASPLWGALVWTGLEYVRTHALTGFPWGVLGYSQYANLTLVQMADITGVLGISFVLVLCNGALAELWTWFSGNRNQNRPKKSFASALIPAAYATLVLGSALGYGLWQLPRMDRMAADAPKPRISVIQGNIAQDQKWDQAFKARTVDQYGRLSLKAPADLVIWPETALPFYYGRDPVSSSQVDEFVRRARSHFLIGSPAAEPNDEGYRYFNRAYMLNPLALVTAFYDKTHLVPFGEYVPLQDLLFFIEKITQEAGNFSPGTTGASPLAFGSHSTGVLICFEILFPDLARDFVLNGADLLTTMTNDAWFDRTSAPAQHFSIGVLRAVENRRSLVRAANTGISGFILPSGRILDASGLFEARAMTRQVPAMSRITPYTRWGDILGIAALVAILLQLVVKPLQTTLLGDRKP